MPPGKSRPPRLAAGRRPRGGRIRVLPPTPRAALRAHTRSLDLLAPSGRLLLVGNAGGDWDHGIDGNRIWQGNITVAGFNAGGYVPAH
ncbi:hypothetical protein ACWEPT_31765, partial [Streptomyces chartreusis]